MISFGLIRIMTLRIEEPLRNFLRHSPKFRKFHFPPFFTEPAIRTPHFHFDYWLHYMIKKTWYLTICNSEASLI